jgi:hypothetical protein
MVFVGATVLIIVISLGVRIQQAKSMQEGMGTSSSSFDSPASGALA